MSYAITRTRLAVLYGLNDSDKSYRLTAEKRLYNIIVQLLTCNTPAIKMVRRFGFTYCGVLPGIALVKNRRYGQAVFSSYISPQPTAEERANLGFPLGDGLPRMRSNRQLNFEMYKPSCRPASERSTSNNTAN